VTARLFGDSNIRIAQGSGRRIKDTRLESAFAHYTSAKGFFMDCSLRVEMMWPDSINDIYIETFLIIGKQMQIWQISKSSMTNESSLGCNRAEE